MSGLEWNLYPGLGSRDAAARVLLRSYAKSGWLVIPLRDSVEPFDCRQASKSAEAHALPLPVYLFFSFFWSLLVKVHKPSAREAHGAALYAVSFSHFWLLIPRSTNKSRLASTDLAVHLSSGAVSTKTATQPTRYRGVNTILLTIVPKGVLLVV